MYGLSTIREMNGHEDGMCEHGRRGRCTICDYDIADLAAATTDFDEVPC